MLTLHLANREDISTESDDMPTPEFDVGPGFRTIYTDLLNLPDPVYLGLTVRIFNYDDVSLYMRVDGYATGWTFTTNDLGALASGANLYVNLDNFGSRAKPAAATSETVTVRLRAYVDAAYTNLKWTFERVVSVVFIKSDDGSWTQDELDNFDDGTVQGWAAADEVTTSGSSVAVSTEYVLSIPYSLRLRLVPSGAGEKRARMYKSFTTPNRTTIYAILDLRIRKSNEGYDWLKYLEVRRDSAVQVMLGEPSDTVTSDYVPKNKWIRIVIPLPSNTSVEIQVALDLYYTGYYQYVYLDDFQIISK